MRIPLLVTSPGVDYREYPRLHICLAITSAAIRLISASNHRLWNTRDQYWHGSVNTICCHGQSGTRLSRYCIHCAPAFTLQCGQERLLHRKQPFLVWQQSGDEQHHCVYPISVIPHAVIFVTDSITTRRTAPSGCFSSQLSQRLPCCKMSAKRGSIRRRGNSIRPVNSAAFLAVHTAGADTGKNGRKLSFRTAGYFRIPFVIDTNKPEEKRRTSTSSSSKKSSL